MNKTITLWASWNISKYYNNYYIPLTHFIYLKYLATESKYNTIYIVSPILCEDDPVMFKFEIHFDNVFIIELPYAHNYISAQKNILDYYKILRDISSKTDIFYCRVPDPFSWMPSLCSKSKTIMHFVGNSIEAIKYNEKWSWFKKQKMILGYLPDYILTLMAAKRSKVYTNGFHLAQNLKRYGIKSETVISSVISKDSFDDFLPDLERNLPPIQLIYIGFTRYAKGMNCLMGLFNILYINNINFLFHIIGDGEMFDEMQQYIIQNKLDNNVILHGQLTSRFDINKLLRQSDLFIFSSLSEGSPRVILEAMSQGIPVISTPVGSLPYIFKDKEDIRFVNYNDVNEFYKIICEYLSDKYTFIQQRKRAYFKVKKNYTAESFFEKIFTYK